MSDATDPAGPLGRAEEQAVEAELARLREEIPPGDPTAAGCVVAMVALIAFVLMPVASRALPLGSGSLVVVGVVLLAVAGVGGAVGIFGGRSARARAVREIEETVGALVSASLAADDGARRNATVSLLVGATRSAGPMRVAKFDREVVAARLGDALAYVERVERFLVDSGRIEPVFTAPPPSRGRSG